MHAIIKRVRGQYILPHQSKRKHKQALASHNYYTWRPRLLLLYAACFFTTPTVPTTITQTHHYNTPALNISVTSPCNTRYNSNWVLQCGDVHPNPGHRRIHQLRRDCRLVPGPPVPLLDIDAQHLVVNTNR